MFDFIDDRSKEAAEKTFVESPTSKNDDANNDGFSDDESDNGDDVIFNGEKTGDAGGADDFTTENDSNAGNYQFLKKTN